MSGRIMSYFQNHNISIFNVFTYIHTFLYVGPIPQSICDLKSLTKLSLYSNELTGDTRHLSFAAYTSLTCLRPYLCVSL